MKRIALPIAVALGLVAGLALAESAAPTPRGYEFSSDWFSHNIPTWEKFLEPYRGRPNLRYLEIGVYEGRSVTWMVENVLTHPTSELVAVDVFADPPDLEARFRANLERSGFAGKSTIIRGPSQQKLQALPLASFDVVYVDGSHTLADVLTDTTLSWELLREGGLLIQDDYDWQYDVANDLRPKTAVDAFVNAFWREIEIVHKGYQFVMRKRENVCDRTTDTWRCSPFGPYLYIWLAKELRHAADPSKTVELSEAEKALIQRIVNTRPYASVELVVDRRTLRSPTFVGLREKLDLELDGGRIVKQYP